MKVRVVELDLLAERDLAKIDDWIAEKTGPRTAAGYLSRIRRYLASFAISAERGTLREEAGQGVRAVGFERTLTIIFQVHPESVTILRVLMAGRTRRQRSRGSGPSADPLASLAERAMI